MDNDEIQNLLATSVSMKIREILQGWDYVNARDYGELHIWDEVTQEVKKLLLVNKDIL